ncbi:hypothetical protein ACTGXD_10375 [Streptococcus suis]|uniref:hypothetical protein n=1 Tax=Streptococcus suis TaxID=1307 RepID=UPI0038B72D6E
MVKQMTNKELTHFKKEVLTALDKYLTSLISKGESSKATKIITWIRDWTNFLKFENKFQSKRLPALQRGSIVSANLGFNLGQEYGGPHYGIVLNTSDSRRNSVVTILPLTSIKPETNLEHLEHFKLNLGDELYQLLGLKLQTKKAQLTEKQAESNRQYSDIIERLSKLEQSLLVEFEEYSSDPITLAKRSQAILSDMDGITKDKESFEQLIDELDKEEEILKNIARQVLKMKKGSIALLNQVTTISKMRIFDPKNQTSVLYDIVLSKETMDRIDVALKNYIIK